MIGLKIYGFILECQKIYESVGFYFIFCVVYINVLISENIVLKCFLNIQVKFWIIFNEVFVVVWLGYGIGVFVFGVSSVDMGVYEVVYNIIRFYI